jgi:hypothetical protein
MPEVPAHDLRSNAGTWAIPNCRLPAVARVMLALLPGEPFDPLFKGQDICTYYFDTLDFDLRKARLDKKKYCTVRLRTYNEESFAISLKTEDQKYRKPLPGAQAKYLMPGMRDPAVELDFLPGDLLARVLDLAGGKPLYQIVEVKFTRFATEDATNRLTLDIDIRTNTGKQFPVNGILENKTTDPRRQPMDEILGLGYAPVKLSKFLWSTTYGVR